MDPERARILYQQQVDAAAIQLEALQPSDVNDFYQAQSIFFTAKAMASGAGLSKTDLSVFSTKWAVATPLHSMLMQTQHTRSEVKDISHR
jgi:hypothetical protein